jgi:hypothetical protein
VNHYLLIVDNKRFFCDRISFAKKHKILGMTLKYIKNLEIMKLDEFGSKIIREK